jgi:capsular exopolysaccharide synthesis family protein
VVTSAIPGDGKTTCSVNLALCLAQIEGARTLLIDGDMRKMNVHKFFKMENGPGLSEVLSGQAPLSNCIVSTGIPNLDLLRAGSVPPNPGELLLSENLKSLLTELSATYNRIVIDTPPVMSTDDTLSLAPNVDGVIFIVKANQTSFRFVERCMTSLKQRGARMFGLVLNHIDTSSAHYYYYNYYSGYYHSTPTPGTHVATRPSERSKKLA